MWLADQSLDNILNCSVVAGGKYVWPAIVVVVPNPAREASPRSIDPHFGRDIGEGPGPIIPVESRGSLQIGQEEIGIAIVVEVDPSDTFTNRFVPSNSRLPSNFLECPITSVPVESVGLPLATDEEIEESIVIVIRPCRRDRVDGIE